MGLHFLDKFVYFFGAARHTQNLGRILNLETRPKWMDAVSKKKERGSKREPFRAALSEIIYRCDLESLYSTKKKHAKKNAKTKLQARKNQEKETKDPSSALMAKKDQMMLHLFSEHWRSIATPKSFFSIKRQILEKANALSLSTFLSESATKKRRQGNEDLHEAVPIGNGDIVEDDNEVEECFITLVNHGDGEGVK